MLQQTLKGRINMIGIEPYGGNKVYALLSPADEDTGYLFQTRRGDVKANLINASSYKASILLSNGNAKVITIEHMLATLYAYGVDNALIKLIRVPSESFRILDEFGFATETDAVPHFRELEKSLCDVLDETGMETQNHPRRLLRLRSDFLSERLSFERIGSGLYVEAITDYPVSGERRFGTQITPYDYKSKLSKSRPYAKHADPRVPKFVLNAIASLANLSFGFGHGFDESNVFLPVRAREEWEEKQYYPNGTEIARHSIVDRLGALALLDGRLEGVKVTARFSGHANDLKVLKKMARQGMFIPQR